MKIKPQKWCKKTGKILLGIVFFISMACYVAYSFTYRPFPDSVFVKRVIDGDTFVDSKNRRYRFIGIDTPELAKNGTPDEPYALKAKEYTRKAIEHKRIRIAFDKDKFDRYNRYLIYVYIPDGRMLNELLLKEGLADVYRKQPFKFKKEFFEIEKQARLKEKGIWESK